MSYSTTDRSKLTCIRDNFICPKCGESGFGLRYRTETHEVFSVHGSYQNLTGVGSPTYTIEDVQCDCGEEYPPSLALDLIDGDVEWVEDFSLFRRISSGQCSAYGLVFCSGPPTCSHCKAQAERGEMPEPGTRYSDWRDR